MRLFVAAETDPGLHRALEAASKALRTTRAEAKWTTPAQWHVTLKFLGDVPDAQLPAVVTAVRRAALQSIPVTVSLAGLGNFGGTSPRVLFARVDDPTGGLVRIAAMLEREFVPIGFAPETHILQPHVTLGRVKHPQPSPALIQAVKSTPVAGEWRIEEIVLFSSVLTPSGPEYEAAARCPLG